MLAGPFDDHRSQESGAATDGLRGHQRGGSGALAEAEATEEVASAEAKAAAQEAAAMEAAAAAEAAGGSAAAALAAAAIAAVAEEIAAREAARDTSGVSPGSPPPKSRPPPAPETPPPPPPDSFTPAHAPAPELAPLSTSADTFTPVYTRNYMGANLIPQERAACYSAARRSRSLSSVRTTRNAVAGTADIPAGQIFK